MFGLTRPAYPAALVTAAALALAACGDNSGTQSVSSTGTTAETSDTGTGATGTTELETTSDETSSTSTTGGPEPTTEAPSTTSSSSDGSSSTTAADECANGLLDGDETDVDCGGDSCPTCDVGQACEIFSDCGTQACVGKLCIVPDCLEDSDCDVLDDPCNQGVCLPNFTCAAYPANEGASCESVNLCVLDATCQAGECVVNKTVNCGFLDGDCKVGVCDPDDGLCYNNLAEDGTTCDDGNGCTDAEVCMGGACVDPNGPGYYFFEDFATPHPQWELDALWEFGPAVASPPNQVFSGEDPSTDHTPTGDNALAGVVIGGIDSEGFHGDYCLTSPTFNTAAQPGPVYLSLWRHLHTDSLPLTINSIIAWDGNSWVELEVGYDMSINDLDWKRIAFNVTALKNPGFQFKICERRLPGSSDMASWSVDDVTIAPTDCTP